MPIRPRAQDQHDDAAELPLPIDGPATALRAEIVGVSAGDASTRRFLRERQDATVVEDLKDFFGLSHFYSKLDAAIQATAKTHLDTQNSVKGVLMPEK